MLYLIFVSLMILPAYAIDAVLSSADGTMKHKFEIQTNIINKMKMYVGTSDRFIYQAQPGTSKVIVHISSKSRFVEIMRYAVRETRLQIDRELREKHCELIFLGIENFDDDEYHLIGAFMLDKIKHYHNQINFTTETIGENRFDRFYQWRVVNFPMYQENAQICGGTLLSRLRSIPHGALRPVESNNKEIRLREYRPFLREVTWPVHVEDNKYVPGVNVSDPEYNLKMHHLNKDIHLVILSGKEYMTAISYGAQSMKMMQIRAFQKEMTKNKEVLIIFGVFNFDWTEIDIVTQIILCHTYIEPDSIYNIFTCGFGMFNTIYKDENARRLLVRKRNQSVTEIMKVLIEEEVKQRSIHMYYYLDNEWKASQIPINMENGRYFPEESLNNLCFPWLNQKIAFIVYDRTETNDPIDLAMVCRSIEALERSGIHVIMIEAINFERCDMHIIAEWIDRHRGNIASEQIAVSGCGIFDTIFQSEITTYDQFHNNKNELQTIRNAYVKSAHEKSVFAFKFDNANSEFSSYPVNTVNSFYEPDLITDRNMFDTRDGRKLYFIITSGYIFRKLSQISEVGSIISSLRRKLKKINPALQWSIFLVGLDNFEDRDSHLFAELVKTHTNDERSLREFVYTFNYAISDIVYQYKDTAPFFIENCEKIEKFLARFFDSALDFQSGTHSH